MTTLVLEGVRKRFGPAEVLKGIDVSLPSGEMLVIVGASGCGKSTLLRLVAGLDTPSAGRIVLDGRDVAPLDPSARDIAMVFQNYALYPHMSVFDNMAYGLRIRGLGRADIQSRVEAAADTLGLRPVLARKPRQLSGGQRQRVAMGRAIVREPKLFLFDEPLSNLDAKLRVQMRAEIKRLQRRMGVTSLYVTHDQVEAMTLGDRLLVLHQGVAVQLATPIEVFERPADTYVAGFIGTPAMNLLDATLSHDGHAARLTGGHVVAFADGRRAGPHGLPLKLGIRPEHLTLRTDGLAMQVDLVERLGSETVLYGRLATDEIVAIKVSGLTPPGEVIGIEFPGQFLHVFDAASSLRIDPA